MSEEQMEPARGLCGKGEGKLGAPTGREDLDGFAAATPATSGDGRISPLASYKRGNASSFPDSPKRSKHDHDDENTNNKKSPEEESNSGDSTTGSGDADGISSETTTTFREWMVYALDGVYVLPCHYPRCSKNRSAISNHTIESLLERLYCCFQKLNIQARLDKSLATFGFVLGTAEPHLKEELSLLIWYENKSRSSLYVEVDDKRHMAGALPLQYIFRILEAVNCSAQQRQELLEADDTFGLPDEHQELLQRGNNEGMPERGRQKDPMVDPCPAPQTQEFKEAPPTLFNTPNYSMSACGLRDQAAGNRSGDESDMGNTLLPTDSFPARKGDDAHDDTDDASDKSPDKRTDSLNRLNSNQQDQDDLALINELFVKEGNMDDDVGATVRCSQRNNNNNDHHRLCVKRTNGLELAQQQFDGPLQQPPTLPNSTSTNTNNNNDHNTPAAHDILLGPRFGADYRQYAGNMKLEFLIQQEMKLEVLIQRLEGRKHHSSLRGGNSSNYNQNAYKVQQVVQQVKQWKPPGRFLKLLPWTNKWIEVNDYCASLHVLQLLIRQQQRQFAPCANNDDNKNDDNSGNIHNNPVNQKHRKSFQPFVSSSKTTAAANNSDLGAKPGPLDPGWQVSAGPILQQRQRLTSGRASSGISADDDSGDPNNISPGWQVGGSAGLILQRRRLATGATSGISANDDVVDDYDESGDPNDIASIGTRQDNWTTKSPFCFPGVDAFGCIQDDMDDTLGCIQDDMDDADDVERKKDLELSEKRDQYDEAVIEVALFNYECFYGLKHGSACFEAVMSTSAGIQGWAAAVLEEKKPEQLNDGRLAFISAQHEAPKKRNDPEEDHQLQRALLESIGVCPLTLNKATSDLLSGSSDEYLYDYDDSCSEGDWSENYEEEGEDSESHWSENGEEDDKEEDEDLESKPRAKGENDERVPSADEGGHVKEEAKPDSEPISASLETTGRPGGRTVLKSSWQFQQLMHQVRRSAVHRGRGALGRKEEANIAAPAPDEASKRMDDSLQEVHEPPSRQRSPCSDDEESWSHVSSGGSSSSAVLVGSEHYENEGWEHVDDVADQQKEGIVTAQDAASYDDWSDVSNNAQL